MRKDICAEKQMMVADAPFVTGSYVIDVLSVLMKGSVDDFISSPPCLESQGFQFDSTFLWSSLVLLPSPIAFLSSFFCYWPIHLPFIYLNLVFSKDRPFRLALVLFLSG